MSWGEAGRLAGLLSKDPTSQVAAALSSWLYPVTRESLVLMDYYDAYSRATFKRPNPYPRPWDSPVKRYGRAAYTTDELRRVLTIQRADDDTQEGDGRG